MIGVVKQKNISTGEITQYTIEMGREVTTLVDEPAQFVPSLRGKGFAPRPPGTRHRLVNKQTGTLGNLLSGTRGGRGGARGGLSGMVQFTNF